MRQDPAGWQDSGRQGTGGPDTGWQDTGWQDAVGPSADWQDEVPEWDPAAAERNRLRNIPRPPPVKPRPDTEVVVPALQLKAWAYRVGIPVTSMIAVGIAAVVTLGGSNGLGTPAPSTLAVGFPPASFAQADFTTDPARATRGVSQGLGRVASSGAVVVATGGQAGARLGWAQFLVSADGGQTWKVGGVHGQDGGEPNPGHAANLIAGGNGLWSALGPNSIWTSQDGQTWTLTSATGIPVVAGDRTTVLKRTGSGFIAAGTNVPAGDPAAATPVIWISANGTTWRRIGGTQLNLPAGTGHAASISHVAAQGNSIVITGAIATTKGKATRLTTGAWRSTDGGTTWQQVTIPITNGATASISGLAATGSGLVAIRPGKGKNGADAVVYTSADGATWTFATTLTAPGTAGLAFSVINGGQSGAVLTGRSGRTLLAFFTQNGTAWVKTRTIGSSATEAISGAAVTSGGNVVVSGTSAGNPASRQPLLTLASANTATRINVANIAGAIAPELAVNSVAADGASQVVVGSANGFPAIWASADSGTSWNRAGGVTPAVLNRPGVQALGGVVHGNAGWLAVGGVRAAAAPHPIVVTSKNGMTWQAADRERTFETRNADTLAAAAGAGGYVIVGRQANAGHTIAAAWFARGLTGWRRAGDAVAGALDGAGDRQMLAVSSGPAGFVAAGAVGIRPAVWLSRTGQTWSLTELPLPANAVVAGLQHVAINGPRVVAVGTERTAAGTLAPFFAVSQDDGNTWTEGTLPATDGPATVTAIAAVTGGFTALGRFGTDQGNQDIVVWMSTNGATWSTSTPTGRGLSGTGVQTITGLTVSGSTLIGVGFSASPVAENPIIWQSPIR
jgi:hypothetical protein